MSFVERILKPGTQSGWIAVDAAPDGLYGVAVMAPAGPGSKPGVAGCAFLPDAVLDVASLTELAETIAVAKCPWVATLERKAYNIFVVEEPSVRSEEMEQSARWAISTLVDYPAEEACVAWMKIPTDKLLPSRTPHMYVVTARNELVTEYRTTFKQANLLLKAVDVQETAHRNIASLAAMPGEGVALLSVGKRGLQLTITFQGELYLDRHVDEAIFGGAADAATLERARERVVLQVQRSLDFIGRTVPFIDIGRVLMAPMPGENDLRDRIAENLPVPVESLDLTSIFDFSRTPQLQQEETQAGYFVALGAALRFLDGKA